VHELIKGGFSLGICKDVRCMSILASDKYLINDFLFRR
jgi:hypothetical protein